MRQLSLLLLLFASPLPAQQFSPDLYSGLRWRNDRPLPRRTHRRCRRHSLPAQRLLHRRQQRRCLEDRPMPAAPGTPSSTDQPTGSIGALAIAPSDPNIIYVGSGEGLQRPDLSVGDGIYKSTDAGKTWRHLGLRDGQQISGAPRRPARSQPRLRRPCSAIPTARTPSAAFSAPPTAARPGRRCFTRTRTPARSTWRSIPPIRAPSTPCCGPRGKGLGRTARGPAPSSGLFKSTDGGDTWQQLTGGLPTTAEGLGRIGIAIAPSDPRRMYALVEAKPSALYRSDDAGAQLAARQHRRAHLRPRLRFRHAYGSIRRIPDIIYVANTSTYRSTDAGQTFTAIKGAPGGDDYHTIWINPQNPEIILLASRPGRHHQPSTAARPGVPGTTSRPRSSIT